MARRWHVDGNDKLKKFGFCIHRCIDGLEAFYDYMLI